MLVFGFPTDGQLERPKPPRSDMSHIVHENGYRDMDAEELKEMLSVKAGAKSFEEWIRAFCERKYNSDFSEEMSRSVGEYLKQFMK
jgi:predicted CopG family antitoxin